MSENTRSTRSTGSKYAPQAALPLDVVRDENSRPSSPVGLTLAEEMVRSGESLPRQGKSSLVRGSLGEADGTPMLEPVGEEDITEIGVGHDNAQTPTSSSGVRVSPPVLIDIIPGHTQVSEVVVLHSVTGSHAAQHGSIPQNVSVAATKQGPPPVKSSHTLRERRMTYLRNMYAMLDQPEPDVPRAILRATTAVRRTKWEIEAGVVGSWLKPPRHKLPAFVARYGGFPDTLLHRQREAIVQEVRLKRSEKLRGFPGSKLPEVPQSVGTAMSLSNNHRKEIEEMLRNANFNPGDLDEADLNGVVIAVMSAAAEAARLAPGSF
ncbi:hypothetical protein L226DRAFT_575364 [Lentinus tigrinus ALCF2SS1-7]|uniref:uncharacterized protein n=1 Tax=Lentinus tigrinus ALCF2SS1-7 TaxID=1328758 RepID=UPI0011662A5D|nr:hypothetical protein L226DRAFT_575364 [Lentinus tigrinus ALCF2SS1-7]